MEIVFFLTLFIASMHMIRVLSTPERKKPPLKPKEYDTEALQKPALDRTK